MKDSRSPMLAGCVLDDAERAAAMREIEALASMGGQARSGAPEGSMADISRRCALAVLRLSARPDPMLADLGQISDELGLLRAEFGDAQVLIAGLTGHADGLSARFISRVSEPLGGDPSRETTLPLATKHLQEFGAAAELLLATGVGTEAIKRNAGMAIPFPCFPPESGSGTSRSLPGVLMLPTGVPPPIYAECLLHECLHTELLLAEWLTGGELATAPTPLPTPWRTVDRPANLLLHGSFVFVTVAQFMKAAASEYERIPGEWLLSAARGRTIRANDLLAASAFRAAQVEEAMGTIADRAVLTAVGERVRVSIARALEGLVC